MYVVIKFCMGGWERGKLLMWVGRESSIGLYMLGTTDIGRVVVTGKTVESI
jgi:hypothetical protein